MCCHWIRIVFCHLLALSEVSVHIFRKRSIFEDVGAVVIGGQTVDLHLAHFSLHEVLEGTVLLSRLTLVPVFDLGVAHARRHFLALDAVGHALIERVTGVCGQADAVEGLHLIIIII